MRTVAALLCSALFVPGIAQAQSSWNPSTDDLVRMLRPHAGGATRGIRALPSQGEGSSAPATRTQTRYSAAPAHSASGSAAPVADEQGSVNLTVQFQTGSDRLMPSATHVLDVLGRALVTPALANDSFKIVGHTDSVGSKPLNQTLSERRANAVSAYLESHYNVPAARLSPVGVGEAEPLVPTAEGVAEPRNRRVQVLNITQ